MPDTPAQWCWFTFFVVGSLGGWLSAAMAVWWGVEILKIARFMDKLD